MKIGDRVRIRKGIHVFGGKYGEIKSSMLPDYQWAVLLDGTSDPDDMYGFNESELETP